MNKHLKLLRDIALSWRQNSAAKHYVADTLWLLAARSWWVISSLCVGVAVARKLGPHDFGIINYAVAYAGIFSVFTSLGVETLAERDLVAHPEKRDRILGNLCFFKFILSLLMLAGLFLPLYYMHDRSLAWYCFLVASGYLFSPFFVVNSFFVASVNNRNIAAAQIITCTLYSAIRIFAVASSLPLEVYIGAEIFINGGYFLISFIIYSLRCGSPLKWNFDYRESFALFRPAVPLALAAIFSTLYLRIDTLMLKYFHDAESVGFYSIAAKFTENFALAVYLIGQVFSVVIFSAADLSPAEYRKQLHRYYFLLCWITLPAIAASLLLGGPVIRFLYGENFIPSVKIFKIYIFTLPAAGVLFAFYRHALKHNRLAAIAGAYCCSTILNVLFNLLLIPAFGAAGAAVSAAAAMPCGFVLSLLFTKAGRSDLCFIMKSLLSLPSFTLDN